jgi:hypothetical protein
MASRRGCASFQLVSTSAYKQVAWNRYSRKFVLKEFWEVTHSPGPIQQIVLCRASKVHSPMYIRL